MSKVAVLDTNKNVLEPCHPAVARRLLKRGEAAVWKRYPFTIILKQAVPVDEIVTGTYTLSVDPGSKVTGLAITTADGEIVYAAELHHRGRIKKLLSTRAGFRRGRRTRNLRYRPARWANRARKVPVLTEDGWTYQRAVVQEGADARKKENTFNRVSWAQLRDKRYKWVRLPKKEQRNPQFTRKERRAHYVKSKGTGKRTPVKPGVKPKSRWRRVRVVHQKRADNGWIAPSLMSRVFNIETWTRRLCKVYPITQLAYEDVKFDMQLMEKPNIQGIEYQQGTLQGYELREYLLERDKRRCRYCGKGKRRLEIDHIQPKSKGGSNRVSNLTMACRPCNQKKGNLVGEALKAACGEDFANKVDAAKRRAATTRLRLTDAAAVNTIRWKIYETLKAIRPDVHTGTGGETAYHRNLAGLPKTHYYDAASVACIPKQPTQLSVQVIQAIGYGRRDRIGSGTFCGRKPEKDKKVVVRGQRGRKSDRKGGAPGFVQPTEKKAESDGFRKFDHVELRKVKKGAPMKWRGVINCFGQNLRVKYFAPEKNDAREGGDTGELQRLQRRDGYSYGNLVANMEFRAPKSLPEPRRVDKVNRSPKTSAPLVDAIKGTQLEFLPNLG